MRRGAAARATHDGGACSIEGRYANYFEVNRNHVELIIDCGQFYAGCPGPVMHTRLVTSPAYARALMESLQRAFAAGESREEA